MRIAALDLGSNSFHLVVAEVHPDGTFTPTVREKEMLRLGEIVTTSGEITERAADAAVAAVRRMRKLAEAAGASEVHARATSALRTAANGDDVVDRIERESGVEVDVIDGLEEARLIFTAVRAAVVLEPAPAICFDLGGGSLEIAVGDAGALTLAASERLGVGRLTATYVRTDPLAREERRAMRDHVAAALRPIAEAAAPLAPRLAILSSGTFESIATMVGIARDGQAPASLNQFTFAADDFLPLYRLITRGTRAERRAIPGMDAKRVDLIAAGAVVLRTIIDEFGCAEFTMSDWALREGIVLDAIARHDPDDWSEDPFAIRRASVLGLARRCSWPEAHSRHVAMLAGSIFDGLRDRHGLDDRDRELLEYAALLHDVGEHVAHEGHEKHAAYLVAHGGLRGFDQDELAMLIALVRWHRRGEVRGDTKHAPLDATALDRCRMLTAILRIADGLDRSRHQNVSGLSVSAAPSLVLLRLATDADPELEVWGARRKRTLLEERLGCEVEFTAHPSGH
ncbi:MAG: HD domain-containing protein [Actinomycetes bacterium]